MIIFAFHDIGAMYSKTEENYLKAIYRFTGEQNEKVGTSTLAEYLSNKPASITDMLRKLSEKELIHYEKSYGVTLTEKGRQVALQVVRKHRIWEVFLVEKLQFGWEEVHEIAEQLEHIQSDMLIEKLDKFLEYPKFDPHGDPIPSQQGILPQAVTIPLPEVTPGQAVTFVSVANDQASFLQYLDKIQLCIGDTLQVLEKEVFDGSLKLKIHDREVQVSPKVAENIFVAFQKQ